MTRSETIRANKIAKARLALFVQANDDERARFNQAIARGAVAVLHTHAGDYAVSYVDANWWYHTPKANGGFGSSWCGCNDGTWTDLLRQAGVARNRINTMGRDELDREIGLALRSMKGVA